MPPRGARGGRGGPAGGGGANRGGAPAGGGDARGGGPPRGGPQRGGGPRGGPRGAAGGVAPGPRGIGPRGTARGGAAGRGGGGGAASTVASSVRSVGVKRPGYGSAGRPLTITTNHFATDIPESIIYHYDAISSEKTLPPARCFEIINILQTSVAPNTFSPRGAYDGRKNLFSTARYAFGEDDTATFEVNPNPQASSDPTTTTGRPPRTYHVTLKIANEINTESLHRYLEGKQSMDNTILTTITALNIAIRMAPSLIYPFNVRSFFTPDERRDIGAGITLWRGYFQSIRPGIGRMYTNVDISTGAMYKEGPLLTLCLEVLGRGMQNVNVLSPSHGLPDRERLRVQRFIQNVKIITKHGKPHPSGRNPPRVVRRLTKEGARRLSFTPENGASMTVAQYFQGVLNRPLQYPDIVCAELATGAIIPLELCTVIPGQIIRKELPRETTKDVLAFSTKKPAERLQSIMQGLAVLAYGQSEYVRQFGINVSNAPLSMTARVIPPPTLKYGTGSKQPTIQPRDGGWNMIDKKMYQPTTKITEWVVAIFEQARIFNQGRVQDMVGGLRQAANAVGVRMDRDPAVIKYLSGQGNIVAELVALGGECRNKTKVIPSLYIVIIPEHGNSDIYGAVKYFGDVKMGVVTQCMRSAKCMKANQQYYANVLLKLNVKQGGVNSVPDARSISFITDPANPTIVFGADAIHPAPGTSDRPSFTALVGSVDSNAAKYVATMRAQETRKEIIQDLESMFTEILDLYMGYQRAIEKKAQPAPKRVIFYRDGVSEGEFQQVLDEELPQIKAACAKRKINPRITLIVVGKRHHTRFFPANPNDGDRRSGNCPAGTVVDTNIVSPVEFDFFIQSHGGLLGTSRPAHYNVLYNENDQLNVDGLQSITHALTHVFARATRSVSIPAPVYYADIVCARAKLHYDPSAAQLEASTVDETNEGSVAQQARADDFRARFQPVHKNISQLMYFC
ncbi:unnamed protein product [Peniophora sp. CBMAI 1063]|nr:unnamed protein product [Peniophora sp. CBMAI 1063]